VLSRVLLYGQTRVLLYGQTRVLLYGQTRVLLYGQTRVLLYGQTRVSAPVRVVQHWGRHMGLPVRSETELDSSLGLRFPTGY
jgi:hypothetical protein